VRFYIFMSLNVRTAVIWVVMSCRFGGAFCLHRHGRSMAAGGRFSENISAFYKITRSDMSEDIYLQTSVVSFVIEIC